MANTAATATSFKKELLLGAHQFSSVTLVSRTSLTAPTTDTIKALLVKASGSVGATQTNVGTPGTGTPSVSNIGTDEVSGSGYSAGGVTVTNADGQVTSSGTTGFWTPSASIVYTTVTLATAFDCMVLYNSTQSGKVIAVFTFNSQTVTANTLTIQMPAHDATNALIRIL